MGRGAIYYRRHSEKVKKSNREWYIAHRDSERAKARERVRQWKESDPVGYKNYCSANYQRNKKNIRIYAREQYQRLRKEFFDNYGSLCICCGEAEKAFLTLEHLNGDGAAHRRSLTNSKSQGNGTHVYLDVKRQGWPKHKYGVLCMNCNTGKYRNKGVCPHVVKKTSAMLMEFMTPTVILGGQE